MNAPQNAEPTFSRVLEQLSDGVCLTDAEERIVYINPAASRMLGLVAEKAKGESFCRLVCGHVSTADSKDCASGCPLRELGNQEESVTYEGRYEGHPHDPWQNSGVKRLADSKGLRIRCFRAPLTDSGGSAGGKGHFTIFEDISAKLDLGKQREDWRNMVAHDLKTPLTTVYTVLRDLKESPPGQTLMPLPQLVDMGVRNCKRMMDLLGLYLDVAKLDAGLMPVRPSRTLLFEIVSDAVQEQEFLAWGKRIKVGVEVPDDLYVLADPDLLPRVVQNLINNALKFTPEDGRVAIKAAREGNDAVSLSIRDSGCGIAPEELPRIFDRYHQAEARRRGKIKGTGLGLTFCKEALKVMKADIKAESSPAGSAFTIRLLAAPAA